MLINLPENVSYIIERLNKSGFVAYALDGVYQVKEYYSTMFNLYIIDGYHAVGRFIDKDGIISWQMIHTNTPIVNNVIDVESGFELSEIDPNDFEFDGKRVRILI